MAQVDMCPASPYTGRPAGGDGDGAGAPVPVLLAGMAPGRQDRARRQPAAACRSG